MRASNLDRTFAGNAVLYLVGPLRSLEQPDRLRARLATIGRLGPTGRLGLLPEKGSRRWSFDPDCRSIAVTTGPAPDMSDPLAALAELDAATAAVPGTPVAIHLAAPWLFLKFDHGLGGGRLFTELIAAIGSADPGFAQPIPDIRCRHPGLRATVHTLRRHPAQLMRALREVTAERHGPSALEPTTGRVSVGYASSGRHFLDTVRAARDSRLPGVSLTALLTAHFLHRLREAGIDHDPTVNFIVDMGRYLPKGRGTLANFVGTAPIASGTGSASELSSALTAYTNGASALIRLGMAYALTLVKGPPENILYKGDSARARVVISDHASTTAAGKIGWADGPTEHVFIRKAPVGFTNQITLALNRVDTELHLTASFYEPYFDPATLHRVLSTTASIPAILEFIDVTD